jgi:hypothetical protein
MASSPSTTDFKDMKKRIRKMMWAQRKDEKDVLFELLKTLEDFNLDTESRKDVIREIARLGNTTAGMGAVLFLQHVAKKNVEVMERVLEVYNEVEESMDAKLEYVVKAG